MENIIQNLVARYGVGSGIQIHGEIEGRKFSWSSLVNMADEIGDRPNSELDIAWPGQGRQHPDGKALCDAGILKSSGSIGGGYHAVSGLNCGQFYDEVYGGRIESFYERVRSALMDLSVRGADGFEMNESGDSIF